MKRWIVLLVVIIVLISKMKSEDVSETSTGAPAKSLKTIPTIKYPSKPQAPVSRVPSSQKRNEPEAIRQDPTFEVNIDDEPLRIGKSFSLVKDMSAAMKSTYNPTMGIKLTENKHYVFFRPSSSSVEAWPVALNRGSKKLFPISHILHVKGVDSVLRDQLKTEGLKEFYYHAGLKFISLEASPATVIKQFQELTARGYKASLEVLKDPHQPK